MKLRPVYRVHLLFMWLIVEPEILSHSGFPVRMCPSLQAVKEGGSLLISGCALPLGGKCADRLLAFTQHRSLPPGQHLNVCGHGREPPAEATVGGGRGVRTEELRCDPCPLLPTSHLGTRDPSTP